MFGVDPHGLSEDLDSLFNSGFNTSSLQSLQTVAALVYNYTSCVDLDRFEGVADEEELSRRAHELHRTKNFMAGV